MYSRITIALVAVLSVANGYRFYQREIPNGDQVPHPCKTNFIWHGVGHKNTLGAGVRNDFGKDFTAENHTWTTHLCEMDSDGDGMTNGQELGDPQCLWTKGNFPSRSTNITHPGICDPWGSSKCAQTNAWVSCDTGEFKCDAVKDPLVKNLTLRFPVTKVPPTQTNYYCMIFDLPQDADYHLIATKPFIDNADVMHHILLTACIDDVPLTSSPSPCYMSQRGCGDVIGLWTVGFAGECLYKEAGYQIGRTGAKRAALQFHWNNPQRRADFTDSSGLTIFYTPKLRPFNAGNLITGQTYLDIEPGMPRVEYVSTCSEKCTRLLMNDSINVTSGVNHMHYLGYSESVELLRGGEHVNYLTNDDYYSYDNPVLHEYDPPIQINPGDSLKTTCVFQSMSKSRTTYFGEGTNDEMCYGLFTFYPKEAMPFSECTTWKNVEDCEAKTTHEVQGCKIKRFLNFSDPETKTIVYKVMDNCNHFGPCRKECPAALAEVKVHPCLHGDAAEFTLSRLANSRDLQKVKFTQAIRSCDCVAAASSPKDNLGPTKDNFGPTAHPLTDGS